MADQLQFGEIVDITITGAKVHARIGDSDSVLFSAGDDTISLALANSQVAITRRHPADGEPQAGDLWRDQDGDTYAAIVYFGPGEDERIYLVAVTGGKQPARHWPDVHKGPSGPIRLLYRLDPELPEWERELLEQQGGAQ